jgi:AcrR family transcriptional regulator
VTASRVPAARSRARRLAPDERRAQILRVADEIFRSQPYDEVSLDQIAEAAGITRGLISHHFGTKRELYVESVRRLMRVPALPVPEYVQGATARSRLDESVDAWLSAIERSRDLYLAATATPGMGDPEIAAIVEEMRDAAARRLAEVLGLGPVAELSPVRLGLLRSWEALAEGAIRQWLEYGRLTREQVRRLMVETASRAAEGLFEDLETVAPQAP